MAVYTRRLLHRSIEFGFRYTRPHSSVASNSRIPNVRLNQARRRRDSLVRYYCLTAMECTIRHGLLFRIRVVERDAHTRYSDVARAHVEIRKGERAQLVNERGEGKVSRRNRIVAD